MAFSFCANSLHSVTCQPVALKSSPMPNNSNQQCYLCITCGTQYPASSNPPASCTICADSRQYVSLDGQQWTTLSDLRRNHSNRIQLEEPGLHSIHTEPGFAISQRAFLIQTSDGNILWDCISLLDDSTVAAINKLGGITAIAISHPHYYTTMIEWSLAFNNAPILLHEADRQWIMRPHANIQFWSGDSKALLRDATLVHTPGHFDGYQVLHWSSGAAGKGVLFSGDQPQVVMDPNWLSFMYSYPNFIPLGPRAVKDIVRRLDGYEFDRIYGAFPKRTVPSNAKTVLQRSAERYLRAIET